MRKLLHSKKGISLMELIICVAIIGLVMPLVSIVTYKLSEKYDIVDKQWTVQEEIEYIMDSLLRDSASGSLSTANYVDLFYEDMETAKSEKTFSSCPELGAFSEAEDGTLTFQNVNTECIYFFNYNDLFYILNRGQNDAKPFKLFEEIKVHAEFSVATNVLPLDENNNEIMDEKYVTDESDPTKDLYRTYVSNGLTVTLRSSEEYSPVAYDMTSSYSLKNMTEGQKINITDGAFTSKDVAGWNANVAGTYTTYPDRPEYKKNGTVYNHIHDAANIVRYTSASAYFGQTEVGSGEVSRQAKCATRFLMINSQHEKQVIDSLHAFRDNVLKGNAVGEFVIEKYYDWSPKVIEIAENNEFIKDTLQWLFVHFAMAVE